MEAFLPKKNGYALEAHLTEASDETPKCCLLPASVGCTSVWF